MIKKIRSLKQKNSLNDSEGHFQIMGDHNVFQGTVVGGWETIMGCERNYYSTYHGLVGGWWKWDCLHLLNKY